MEWQPIETAPTDCDILVYDVECGVAKAKFFDNNVTHWMPLPEPPKES